MTKHIGYARVSTRAQDSDRQIVDLKNPKLGKVRADDLYVDHGVSGAKETRPALDQALAALEPGDTLVVATLDRLGRSTENMLRLAADLRTRGVALKVLNLGGEAIDTSTPTGSMLFTVMVALAQMELDIKKERALDSVSKRRAEGKDLGGRRARFSEGLIRRARQQIDAGGSPSQIARDLGMSRATLHRRLQRNAESVDLQPGEPPAALPRKREVRKGGLK